MSDQTTEMAPLGPDDARQLGVYAGYQVPEGTAEVVQAEAATPTTLDEFQRDAGTPKALPEWPEDAPELRPLMRLPYDERADAMDAFAEVQALQAQAEAARKAAEGSGAQDASPAQAAMYYRTFAKLDKLLTTVAVDKTAYEQWPGRWRDDQFTQLWQAYQARMSPGEASRSSS